MFILGIEDERRTYGEDAIAGDPHIYDQKAVGRARCNGRTGQRPEIRLVVIARNRRVIEWRSGCVAYIVDAGIVKIAIARGREGPAGRSRFGVRGVEDIAFTTLTARAMLSGIDVDIANVIADGRQVIAGLANIRGDQQIADASAGAGDRLAGCVETLSGVADGLADPGLCI